jgi:glucan phosphoethanolaminetransferase (alkaline phosphatase superfamily)
MIDTIVGIETMIDTIVGIENIAIKMISMNMVILLFLSLLLGLYLLACAPCRQHLLNGVKRLLVNPKCLLAIAITILVTIVAVFTVSGKKEIGVFNREIKCPNAVKNEYGIFLASGDCKCSECSPKTTPPTPLNAPVVSDSK